MWTPITSLAPKLLTAACLGLGGVTALACLGSHSGNGVSGDKWGPGIKISRRGSLPGDNHVEPKRQF